jgi:hypothetical protein
MVDSVQEGEVPERRTAWEQIFRPIPRTVFAQMANHASTRTTQPPARGVRPRRGGDDQGVTVFASRQPAGTNSTARRSQRREPQVRLRSPEIRALTSFCLAATSKTLSGSSGAFRDPVTPLYLLTDNYTPLTR